MTEAAYERIAAIPHYGDAQFNYQRMKGAAFGSAILTVGEKTYIALAARRLHGGADVWGEIAIDDGAAELLAGGRSITFNPAPADTVRLVDGNESASHPLKRTVLSVDQTGRFSMSVEFTDAEPLAIDGRLVGACEYIDDNSSLLHVVDPATEPRCDRIIGWL